MRGGARRTLCPLRSRLRSTPRKPCGWRSIRFSVDRALAVRFRRNTMHREPYHKHRNRARPSTRLVVWTCPDAVPMLYPFDRHPTRRAIHRPRILTTYREFRKHNEHALTAVPMHAPRMDREPHRKEPRYTSRARVPAMRRPHSPER